MKKVLVIAVHPDDETLGCGGTLLRHKGKGDEINWLIITSANSDEKIAKQQETIDLVAKRYNFKNVAWLKLSTTKTDTYPLSEIIEKISAVVKQIQPDVIYLPSPTDTHHDHGVIFKAAWNCTKTFRYPFISEVYAMCVPSETDFTDNATTLPFIPNKYVDISAYLEEKLEILALYKTELQQSPFPRSIENVKAYATINGCKCACASAEAFMALKIIER